MLLNGLLAAFFIVAGSFNGLVVLIGTLARGNSRLYGRNGMTDSWCLVTGQGWRSTHAS